MTRQLSSVSEHIVSRITHALTDANMPVNSTLVVAYSGGVDSSVLLQAAIDFREQHGCQLHAVHVHHGLSVNADAWARHCELQCRLNDIEFHLRKVNLELGARKSIEAEARKARYNALLEVCRQVEGALLLGQHAEDQLETVLLQLKRGAGPQGLSGMGESQLRGGALVIRPMLALEKHYIVQFAREEGLQWVEDESNTCNTFDRNFLRNEILPLLRERWPQLSKTAGRSAQLCAEQTELLNRTANTHLSECKRNDLQLSGSTLAALSMPWRAAVLRAWFAERGELVPSKAQTDELLSMLQAKQDATPEVRFKWGKVARFNGDLYWVRRVNVAPIPFLSLEPNTDYPLPWLKGTIRISSPSLDDRDVITLKTNIRSLKVKPEKAGVSKTLKEWFKVWRVPLWERSGIPVVFVNDNPVALIKEGECIYFKNRDESIEVLFKKDIFTTDS